MIWRYIYSEICPIKVLAKYQFSILTAQSGVNWLPFSVPEQAVVSTDFSDLAVERFYVKLPCEESVWFKLFLRRADGANSHVELYSKVSLPLHLSINQLA